jgi:hypothetical protein
LAVAFGVCLEKLNRPPAEAKGVEACGIVPALVVVGAATEVVGWAVSGPGFCSDAGCAAEKKPSVGAAAGDSAGAPGIVNVGDAVEGCLWFLASGEICIESSLCCDCTVDGVFPKDIVELEFPKKLTGGGCFGVVLPVG